MDLYAYTPSYGSAFCPNCKAEFVRFYGEDDETNSNKRTNHFIEVNGKVMTISQCAKQYNISKSTIRYWAKQYNDVLQIKNCGAEMSGGE